MKTSVSLENDKADPEALVRHLLLEAGETLSPAARTVILGFEALAVPTLLRALEDENLGMTDAPGEGWAPIHAAELLIRLQASEAVEPLIRILARTDPLGILHDRIVCELGAFGEKLVEPALRACAQTRNAELRDDLCAVLTKTGIKDERIFELLRRQLRENPEMGASNLAEYGDPRALPDLGRAFDRYRVVRTGSVFANHTLVEFRAAIEELGGNLTADQLAKCEQGREPILRFQEQLAGASGQEPRGKRVARNDPCWCGSGKKYKKCHLSTDARD